MYFGDMVMRILMWLAGVSFAAIWIYGLATFLLPRMGALLSGFLLTPGGLLVLLLTWRALGR